ncbi:MAG: hypothetical protein IPM24_10565 [Bryobacterales bacterium]|nr:hypothetical protein [Bryobacterales bacterium]
MALRRTVPAALAAALLLILTSCSTGPAPPAKGSPEFLWLAAQETFRTGDYERAADHLEALTKTDNEFRSKAVAMKFVLLAGIAEGYMDLAEHYEFGARANKANPTPFRKMVIENRTHASREAVRLAELAGRLAEITPAGEITLDFPAPRGSAAMPPVLLAAAKGTLPSAAEAEQVRKTAIERGVLLAVCRSAGAPKDAAKMHETFKAPPVTVKVSQFALGAAEAYFVTSQLFSRQKLDLPDRERIFLESAQRFLDKADAGDSRAKDLKKQLEAAHKQLSRRT